MNNYKNLSPKRVVSVNEKYIQCVLTTTERERERERDR